MSDGKKKSFKTITADSVIKPQKKFSGSPLAQRFGIKGPLTKEDLESAAKRRKRW